MSDSEQNLEATLNREALALPFDLQECLRIRDGLVDKAPPKSERHVLQTIRAFATLHKGPIMN